ncbi:MAG: Holliday junction ATP-dependent DNA helicase RuvB [Chlamydiia bacterium]|nr:Holliday junction ATP-dependent DNA helicase RuvB [Chlamydiia bacterium]MCH9615401.1 Holliday junction ATP-dependent DNA helicase RuvB [Chlamydiia bacterium]MCH9628277.1 Holliday junction ATP-dependent DNA helicase RuvB [Chlamydiia bacterium]
MSSHIESSWQKTDKVYEKKLRPHELSEFVGQNALIDRLNIFTGAALKRGESLGHLMFYGPPGLGKTTLAHILAEQMGSKLVVTSGPTIEKAGDLAGLLTSLETGDLLFIDEIHRLSRTIEEYLYPALEDFRLDLLLDTGPSARSVSVTLKPFTLVGATTRFGALSSPLRSRFAVSCRLDYYSIEELSSIIVRSSSILGLQCPSNAAKEIASRSRGTPRIANNLLKWVRDYSQVENKNEIDLDSTKKALEMLNIDEKGLDEMDKKILSTIIEHHQGGPVGIATLAAALQEDRSTLEEVNEPYLLMQGFIKRTLRGREATELAYKHLRHK